MMKKIYLVLGMAVLMACAAQADNFDIDVDGLVGVVSDYREKGVSLSDKDVAVVGNLRLSTQFGLFTDLYAASLDDAQFLSGGHDVMLEGTMGYGWEDDTYAYGLMTSVQSFHGGQNGSRDFPKIQGFVSRDYGILYTKASWEYSFDGRWYSNGNDAVYGAFDVELPIPHVPNMTLISHVGYDMIGGLKNPWDWKVGLSTFYKDVEFTLMYEDSTLKMDDAKSRVIVGARWYF